MSDYERTVQWLYTLEAAKGMDFKLERVALALERLGDPHRRYSTLHVAGTNGKGSVAAMLESILSAAGYRVGLYTSPHLVELPERVRIGDRQVGRDELATLADEIRGVAAGRGIDLTFFEFLTVLAFLHFARAGVDVAVVEVGLGGRLDATNVIDPAACAITTIGLDHVQWLGSTLAAIAAEKGGIIKPRRPVVLGRIGGEAEAVLRAMATRAAAPMRVLGRDYHVRVDGHGFTVEGLPRPLTSLRTGLRGRYQYDNAATALALLTCVSERLPVSEDAVRRGLARVRWPGRLEVIEGSPPLVLDGAHNADGMAALVAELPGLVGDRALHVLFAVMADKDWPAMVDRLAPRCRSAVVTEVLPPRGAPAEVVAERFRRHCPVTVESSVQVAWERLVSAADPSAALVVTGSLYLIGAVHAARQSTDRKPARPAGALHP